MDIQQKLMILQKLDTKKLTERLKALEEGFFSNMLNHSNLYLEESQNIGRAGGDSPRVKELLAMVTFVCPAEIEGKKLTADMRAAWLTKQRTEIKELNEAIQAQAQAQFQIDSSQATIDATKEELRNIRAVLALKTAQIGFLSGGEDDSTKIKE